MDRLCHDMIAVDVRQLVHDEVDILLGGIDEYIFFRNYLSKPVIGLLQLCATHAEEVKKLLWFFLPAAGP